MNRTTWYYWTHANCKLAYSKSKEEGAPIYLWNFANKELDAIGKVGDDGWELDGCTSAVLPSSLFVELDLKGGKQ